MSSIPEDHSATDTVDVRNTVTRREFLADTAATALGLLVLPGLARAQSASTFDFYISPTGSDSNPGTLAQPWSQASLGLSATTSTSGTWSPSDSVTANMAKMAGKRIGILPGNYCPSTHTFGVPGGYGVCYWFTGGGTSANPTYIASCDANGNYSPLTALFSLSLTFNGSSFIQTSQRGDLMWIACNYVTIDGIAFNYSNSGAFIRLWNQGSGTGDYITIQNCSFQNINTTAIYGSTNDNLNAIELKELGDNQGTSLTVYNCYFNSIINGNNAITSSSFNANCIGGFSYSNVTIDHCTFTKCFGAYYPKGACGPYVFTNNFVHDAVVLIRDANECDATLCSPQAAVPRNVIRNNLAYNVGGMTSGDAAYPGQVNVDIYNNTICFTGSPAVTRQFQAYSATSDSSVVGSHPGPTTSTLYNNIFYNLTSSAVPTYYFAEGNYTGGFLPYNQIFTVMDYNCHDAHGFSFTDLYNNASASSLAAWRSLSGHDAHSFQNNTPGFIGTPSSTDPTQAKLASGSVCKGTGSTTGLSTGAACDMGAWGGANPPTQIGYNLSQSSQAPAIPMAPTLTVG